MLRKFKIAIFAMALSACALPSQAQNPEPAPAASASSTTAPAPATPRPSSPASLTGPSSLGDIARRMRSENAASKPAAVISNDNIGSASRRRLPGSESRVQTSQHTPSPSAAAPKSHKAPLQDSELLALVAGDAPDENIVHEIGMRGLAFHLSDGYQALLTTAGADAAVIKSAKAARVVADPSAPSSGTQDNDPLLQDLAKAGKQIRAGQFADALAAVKDAREHQFGSAVESAFVAGELLIKQEDWANAAGLYSDILQRTPDFPSVHSKLAYVLHHLGDDKEALQQTQAALNENPNDAEAHINAGQALDSLRKFDASEREFKLALAIKPDAYGAHSDLGNLLYDEGKYSQAILEYKKAIVLAPKERTPHYNLGIAYESSGNLDSAIREYREAKRLDPRKFDTRINLAGALSKANMYNEAVVEWRELEAMAPDSPVCHSCLGLALFRIWNFKDAEEEFNTALRLDATNAPAHWGLGAIREENKDYDGALEQFRKAEQLDDSYMSPVLGEGRVLLAKSDLEGALAALKHAEDLDPSRADVHDFYGQALQRAGKLPAAISEFQQAVALDSKSTELRLRLAAALEKNRNWNDALDQYRKVEASDAAPIVQEQIKAAHARMTELAASMAASGDSAGAAKLKASLNASQGDPGISARLNRAMQAAQQSMSAGRVEEAAKSVGEALDLAQKIQPHDDRLTSIYMARANIDAYRKDFPKTQSDLELALKTAQELHGADSPMITMQLQALGMFAAKMDDFATALNFLQRALDIDSKAFGEANGSTADALRVMSTVYVHQKDYQKAEELLLRAVRIDDTYLVHGGGTPQNWLPLWSLCQVYDQWQKPAKAAPCYQRMLEITEPIYGAESPALVSTLRGEASALRALGNMADADKVDQRIRSIQTTETNPK